MPGHHDAKQKRQAKHVADSERKRGMSPKRAESVGWATVNKKSVKKGSSLAHVQNQLSSASSVVSRTPTSKPKTPSGLSHVQRQLDNASSVVGKSKKKSRLMKDDGAVTMPSAGGGALMGKAMQIVSLDEYYRLVKGPGGLPGAPKPAPAPGAPAAPTQKFPRKMKPTVKMKPISDEEAMANLKQGKHFEKKLATLKALATGYGKVSGGGALKAPNRGFRTARTMRDRPSDLSLSINDLERAMEAMPQAKVGPPKVYLPGIHNPKSPVRAQPGIKKPKSKSMNSTITASMRPSVVSDESPRALDGGGAALLANSLAVPALMRPNNVVHKSGGDLTMSKTNFNDLFKSELDVVTQDVLCECPHCEVPITKSDLEKAHSHKGKGAATHITGAERGKSSAHVVDQNPTGGVMRGGEGKGVLSIDRGVPGAKKTDVVAGVQNSKGSKTRKAIAEGSESEDDESDDDKSSDDKAPPFGKKDVKKAVTVRSTGYVHYVDDGEDERIAKAIASGLGGPGSDPTQPMDLNNDLSRLLY